MGRNATLDYARMLAACGIVVFHAGAPGAKLGYAALPFFLILLVVLAAPAAGRKCFGAYARDRARRLLVPWFGWSLLYGAMKLAEVAVTGVPLDSEFHLYMILTGPALHLWFLPFAFAACLLVHPLARLAEPLGQTDHGAARRDLLALGLMTAGLAGLALCQGQPLPTPLAQWVQGLPSICLGLAFAVAGGTSGRVSVILIVCVVLALAAGWTSGLLQITVAGTALVLCMALPRPPTGLSHRAGGAAMGIYLAHPMVLSVLERTTAIAPKSLVMAGLGCVGALGVSIAAEATLKAIGTRTQTRRLQMSDAARPNKTA